MPHLAFVVFTYSPHSGTLPPHGVPPASPHESGQKISSKYFLIPQNIFPRTYDGRGARGAPGVVFVDVVLGARLGRPVDRPLLGLVDGRLLRDERKGYMIQINLKLTVYTECPAKLFTLGYLLFCGLLLMQIRNLHFGISQWQKIISMLKVATLTSIISAVSKSNFKILVPIM